MNRKLIKVGDTHPSLQILSNINLIPQQILLNKPADVSVEPQQRIVEEIKDQTGDKIINTINQNVDVNTTDKPKAD